MKERNVTFNAFTLVHTDEVIRSWGARMDYLEKLGFITVEREHTSAKDLPDAIARWTKKVDSAARSTMQVGNFLGDMVIEIEAIATEK